MTHKLPPQDIEAEKSILGALLIDSNAIVKIADYLFSEHFYKEAHGSIYKAMVKLYEDRQPTDLITVRSKLEDMGVLKQVGGAGYLAELVNTVPTAAHVENYAQIVRDCFVKRSLIEASVRISEMSFEKREVKSDELLDQAEQLVFSISQKHGLQQFQPISRTLEISFDRLDELVKNPGELRGISTGFKSIDRYLSGLQEGNMLILAARPSVGKTSLMLNIAQYAAVVKKVPIGIFSLETSSEQLANRLLSAQADVDGWRITTGQLEGDDFKRIGEAMGQLAESPIYIDDTPGQGVMSIRTKARRLHMEYGVKVFMVDYLQLSHARNLESRVQEVSEISMALKSLARELNVPILVLSQLSRAIEQRGDHRPQLSDLRDSGSIEQDADVVMFLYRPDSEERENLKLLIAKHRNGPTGEVDLYFKSEQTRFFEMDSARE